MALVLPIQRLDPKCVDIHGMDMLVLISGLCCAGFGFIIHIGGGLSPCA
jgi:hypothetical protein